MRLRPIVPQLSDRPESLARALYKASTGSIKSAEYLLGGLGFLVVAELGRETWQDAAIGEWKAALAKDWPPRPPEAMFAAMLSQAHEDGIVARDDGLAGPELDADDLTEPFRIGMLERFMDLPSRVDEPALLASALRWLTGHWDGPTLINVAVEWAWPRTLDLDRRAVTVGLLSVMIRLAAVPIERCIDNHFEYLEVEEANDAWTAEALRETLRALGATEAQIEAGASRRQV